MRKNVGKSDSVVRFILAAVLVTLLVTHTIVSSWGVFLGWLFVSVFVLTGLDGTCPLYILLGINTRGKHKSTN